MRTASLIFIFLQSLGMVALAATSSDPLTYFRDLAETRNFSLGRPVSAKLSPDGKSVIYLRGGPRDPILRLYEYSLPAGPERELLTPAQLLGTSPETLTTEEKARRERARISTRGFTKFDLSKDGTRLLVTLSGQLYVVNRADLKVTILPGKNWIDPRFSPDGTAIAAVSAGELHIIELNGATLTARALTSGANATLTHGTAEFVAQEEMARSEGFWWSPDSRSIAYQQTDESAVEIRHIADPLHPEATPTKFAYPAAGTTNATVRLGVIARNGGSTRWVQWDSNKYPYLTRVLWRDDEAPLILYVMDRAQQTGLLLRADPATGSTAELLRETDPAWVNLDERGGFPRWLPGAKEFLWSSESRGIWQIELRSASGSLIRSITPADFIYKGFAKFDSLRGDLYLLGSKDPRETQIWRFSLPSGLSSALTSDQGQHSAIFSENASAFIHSYDLFNGTSGTEVLTPNGDLIATLPSHAEKLPTIPRVELTHTASEPSFFAAVVRPRDFDPKKKYPVILYAYAGPHTTVVTASARAYLNDQWMADQGYIVARLDGRGTPFRGRDWERAIRGNLIDLALADQIAGLRALGTQYPEMDLTRVGVTGWSFGGYFAAMATLRRPDIFSCGIAGAPVITWENYDTFYTERYLGLPQTAPEAYKVSSVLSYAAKLERPLLLIHGLTDDNVYAQHTLQLCDALFMAGKTYEFLPMLGTHMAGSSDPMVKLRQQQRMMDFFSRYLSSR